MDLDRIALLALNKLDLLTGPITARDMVKAGVRFNGFDFSFFFLNVQAMAAIRGVGGRPEAALRKYRALALRMLREAVDVRPVLSVLTRLGGVSIATNGTIQATRAILRAMKISDLIPRGEVYTSEEYGAMKSEGVIHRAIRQRWGDRSIWAVGDSIKQDLRPASAAGMLPVWVTEFCTEEELREMPPPGTVRIKSISELPGMFGRRQVPRNRRDTIGDS